MVVKQVGMDWKMYVRLLAEQDTKITDFERMELAGYLLRRDNSNEVDSVNALSKVATLDDGTIADCIASYLTAESPESIEDLFNAIKANVVHYYNNEIDELVFDAIKSLAEERLDDYKREKPVDDYDPEKISKL